MEFKSMSMHHRLIAIIAFGLVTACGPAISSGPTEFKCDSPSPPFPKGQTYTIIFNPELSYVEVGQYQYTKEVASKEKYQQGWRRWTTNYDRQGKANSWTELNIITGELIDIGTDGQTGAPSLCSRVK